MELETGTTAGTDIVLDGTATVVVTFRTITVLPSIEVTLGTFGHTTAAKITLETSKGLGAIGVCHL